MKNISADVIYGFAASLLHHRYDSPQPTPEFHIELWNLFCSDQRLVAIAAPRGHAKSTAVTHTAGLASVLFKERDFVLIVSDTEGQAIQFLGDIKKELQENEDLITLFGIKKFVKDTESDIIVQFTTGEEFRIIAKGSEQKVRGLKWRNKRPNLIIGDDLENDEIVMNDDRRDKFLKWFNKALLPCGSDDCLVRIVGTILHMDSMLERRMPEWGAKTTKTDGIRHWSDATDSEWLSIRYQAHNEDYTKILWPEKFPEERLRAIKRTYIEDGDPEGYAQEYLNYPIDEENAFFQKSDFRPLPDDWERDYMEYYVGGDLAISEKDGRAYSVFVVAGLTSNNVLRVVDVIRRRMDSLEIIDTIFELHLRYNPQAFFLEKENIARSIGPILTKEQMERNIFINLNEDTLIVPTQDKVKRAQAIRARARAGGVQVDTKAPWYDGFITECVQFPRGVYKDQVDSFAMVGLGLAKMMEVPTRDELDEEEWEEEFGDMMFTYDGRDGTTGY
jgi:predicted phage terminase large subunit-like protein